MKRHFLLVAMIPLMGFAVAPAAKANTVSSTFKVTMTITKACAVTAGTGSDIALGSHAASDTNIAGNNTISVNCSKTTPYYIGLAPSNANTGGAGTMAGATGGNTDAVPYQLRSVSGPTGTIWGNTATASAVGNGVGGTGTGANVSHTVYVTVPGANYTPDSYSDTVTVNVNF
jgi:spore coat protein U-like protein